LRQRLQDKVAKLANGDQGITLNEIRMPIQI